MTQPSSLTASELTAISKAVELFQQIIDALSPVEANPRDWKLDICTEVQPGYLGWIGYDESGALGFQPAAAPKY
jgi:hypothetical protein